MYKFNRMLIILIAIAINGCTNLNLNKRPTYTNFQEAGIETNDSNALKIHKLGKHIYRVYDVKISSEKYEKGGYGLGLAAFDVTTGAMGIGLSSAAGLSGALGSMGIGLLLSPSKKPFEGFIHFHIVPTSTITQSYQEDLGQKLLATIPHTEVINKRSRKAPGNEYYLTNITIKPKKSASLDLKAKLDDEGNYTFSYITKKKAASSINGKLLEPLLGMELKNENYDIYSYGIYYGMAADFVSNRGYTNEGEISLLYVPPRLRSSASLPEAQKYIIDIPYLYNLNTNKKMLFVSPRA